jgi:hypothetical protein
MLEGEPARGDCGAGVGGVAGVTHSARVTTGRATKLRIAVLVSSVLVFTSCHQSSKTSESSMTESSVARDTAAIRLAKGLYTEVLPGSKAESAMAAKALQVRSWIDTFADVNPKATTYAARLANNQLVVTSRRRDFPDSVDEAYLIVSDTSGRVRALGESPLSQSGDWTIATTHYFDSSGSTVVVEREASFFNGCTNPKGDSTSGEHEAVTSYFGPKLRLVRRTFVRRKFDGKVPGPSEICNDSFQTDYKMYPSWDSLANATGLGAIAHSTHR